MTQRYGDPRARERMSRGMCPECGNPVSKHDGWGGPNGCYLTDNGAAQRIAEYLKEKN